MMLLRLGTTTCAMLAFAVLALGALPATAQSEDDASAPVRLFELTSVAALKKGDHWVIKVKGKASKIPEKAVVEVAVNRSFANLERFRFELPESRRFQEEFVATRINGEVDKLFVTLSLPLVHQPKSVLKVIEKKGDVFPKEQQPWATSFAEKMFMAGTQADLNQKKKDLEKFFKSTLKEIVALNKRFENYRSEAVTKTRFTSGGGFDSEKWLKAVEGDIRDPLRKVQEGIMEKVTSITYLDAKRDLGYIRQFAASVAKRTYDRSHSVHRELGQSVHPKDRPEDIDVATSKKPTKKYMRRLVSRICDSRGIDMKELQ
ncbi:MAG: hypothetical protein AAF581_16630 [Planctomycetota bacterium]